MQHSKTSILQLFANPRQYLIPIFQRGYVWTLEEQIKPLWEDIADRAQALIEYQDNQKQVGICNLKPLRKHFLGTLVLGSVQNASFGYVPTMEVIDGQQRITTLQILLIAFRDVATTLKDEFINQSFSTLTRNPGPYMVQHHHYKVWPTNAGRADIEALASLGALQDVCAKFPLKREGNKKLPRTLMVEAYLYFYGVISLFLQGQSHDDPVERGSNGASEQSLSDLIIHSIRHHDQVQYPNAGQPLDKIRAKLLLDTLSIAFQLMALDLEEEDDPQVIFETLNARGALLFPSDLIRNFIFLQATRKEENVDFLYNKYWREFDEKTADGYGQKGNEFWKQEERQGRLKNTRLDLLLYHYVSLRTQEDVKVAHVFQAFKTWWEQQERETQQELQRLNRTAAVFAKIIDPHPVSRFGLFCARVKALDTAMLTPLILYLREHYAEDADELLTILTDLESYLVRRYICGLSTKGYNRIFLSLLSELVITKKADVATIRAYLLNLKGDSQVWPDDAEFQESWLNRAIYQPRRLSKPRMLLEALELGLHTNKQEEIIKLVGLTIEHVLPQAWKPEVWPIKDNSDAAKSRRNQLLHTIGNLTLITQPMNSSLSCGPFQNKRPAITQSLLTLNAYFQQDKFLAPAAIWAEETLVERGRFLFAVAKRIWPHPRPEE